MRYFFRLSYCGAAYCGWQVQPHDPSVQQTLEDALSTLLRRPVAVTGAGRTDTGVNAATMMAHADLPDVLPLPLPRLLHGLNGLLPRDIAVHAIAPVHHDAHARFDATSRTYKYFLHTAKSPFLHPYSLQCRPGLDFGAMNVAAELLLHYRDFTSFSKLHTDVKTHNCTITEAHWQPLPVAFPAIGLPQEPAVLAGGQPLQQWVFTITADRFLRNMVRAIVGTLIDVGYHRIAPDHLCHIIEQKDRCAAGTSVPAHPLFLWDITYPYDVP